MKPVWKFGNNDTGEKEGPNNPGIANFAGDRTGALVREIIQNSIDARASEKRAVEVSFQTREIPLQALDLPHLKRVLQASSKYPDLAPRYKSQFRRGIRTLNEAIKAKQIQALSIVDSNTTGASDQKGQLDKWHSLTKTVGSSSKDSPDSAGTFGIGKHAPFAVTDLRTILYSTAYLEKGTNGALRRRFTGKSILVSHELKGKLYRASGWLEKDGSSLKDDSIPDEFRLDSSGTEIDILGFNDPAWEDEARESVITHFFHALAHDNLRVRIGSTEITSKTLDVLVANEQLDDKILRLIAVSRSNVVESTHLKDIGRVNLRIIVDNDGEHGQRTLALVRDAGMMITDRLGSMHSTRTQRMVSFPRHWLGFTAIVECLSEGNPSLLREAEGPRHDSISADFADSSERRQVSRSLRALGEWVREAIEKYAKLPEPSTKDNADELADILPLPGGGMQLTHGNGRGSWEITDPQQSSRAPRGLRTPGRRGRSTTIDVPGPDPRTPRSKRRTKGKRRSGRRTESIQVPFNDLRRLPSGLTQWPEHSARFTFNSPQGAMRHIRLYAIGEDGRETQVDLERAYIDGRRLPVKQGEIAEIPPDRVNGDRLDLELKAIRPIADRRLEIRLASRGEASRT